MGQNGQERGAKGAEFRSLATGVRFRFGVLFRF
jgi:hypothetical protein